MGTIKGTDFIMIVSASTNTYKPAAHSTSASIDLSTGTIGTSTKSSGKFDTFIGGRGSWTASVEGLVSFDSNICNLKTMAEAQKAQSVQKIAMTLVKDANVPLTDTSGYTMTVTSTGITSTEDVLVENSLTFYGEAIITSVSISSPDNDNVTYSVSYQGTGEWYILEVQ
jgi:predicted secreted protein